MQNRGVQIVTSLALAVCFFGLTGQAASAEPPIVFAASSLREVVEEIAGQFANAGGSDPVLVFAASSTLARQVAQGAPADVVLLADTQWGDWLVAEGAAQSVVPFAANRLVIATRDDVVIENIAGFPDLLAGDVLAMAQLDAVPAGRYGKAAFEALGLWDDIAPSVVQAANVRAALRFVERGEARFGVGYASDLAALPDLTEAFAFPADVHAPITYVAAQTSIEGEAFLMFLQMETAAAAFQTWGFSPLPSVRE